MTKYYLAVDIGASSGRHILFHHENGIIKMEEIHRFENGMKSKNGHMCWDVDKLFGEIIYGMRMCKEVGKTPVSMAVDTWAVDYVLLDKDGNVLGDVYGYRDDRTEGVDKDVYKLISEKDLYRKTGIQKQKFNTIYQLMADKKNRPDVLDGAETFLMLPDYFTYLLTGVKASEYTNATSTQLVDAVGKTWDYDMIKRLGFPEKIFVPITEPGNSLGMLSKQVADEVGYSCEVIQCATHDTASAVMAMPGVGGLYISSGTWSLMGVENDEPMLDDKDMEDNFTNEGGYDYKFRYLKNIMGLWMIQTVRHETGDKYSFAELAKMAEECESIDSVIDVNDDKFLAPDNMTETIRKYCEDTGQKVPGNIAEMSKVIYVSLAKCYGETVEIIEKNTGKHYDSINIIGGGCQNNYLNVLTAEATGRRVYAGPVEATAIGNALAQMIKAGDFNNLTEARKCVINSFDVKEFHNCL